MSSSTYLYEQVFFQNIELSQNVHNIYCQHITVSNGKLRSGVERWGGQRFNLLSIKGCVDEGNGSGLYFNVSCSPSYHSAHKTCTIRSVFFALIQAATINTANVIIYCLTSSVRAKLTNKLYKMFTRPHKIERRKKGHLFLSQRFSKAFANIDLWNRKKETRSYSNASLPSEVPWNLLNQFPLNINNFCSETHIQIRMVHQKILLVFGVDPINSYS